LLLHSELSSLFKSFVVLLEERPEGDAHIVVLVLLAQREAEGFNALPFEGLVDCLLLNRSQTEHVVGLHIFSLFPEGFGLFDDVLPDHVHCLVVLEHQSAVKCVGLGSEEDDLLTEFLHLKIIDLTRLALAARVANGLHLLAALSFSFLHRHAT